MHSEKNRAFTVGSDRQYEARRSPLLERRRVEEDELVAGNAGLFQEQQYRGDAATQYTLAAPPTSLL